MDISAGVVVREGQLVRKGPELVSLVKYQEVFFVSLPPRLIIFLIYIIVLHWPSKVPDRHTQSTNCRITGQKTDNLCI